MYTARIENPLHLDFVTAGVQSTLKNIAQQVAQRHAYTKTARVIFIDGRNIRFESSDRELSILLHAAPPSAKNVLDVTEQVIMNTVGIPSIMQGGNAAYKSFKDANGIDLAYYDKKHADLYIPFNMFALEQEPAFKLFEELLNLTIGELQHEEAQRFMWGGENHAQVENSLRAMVKGQEHTSVATLESRLRDQQEEERNSRDRLRRSIVQVTSTMKQLDDAREGNGTLDQKIAHEFAIVQKNPDVKHIEVRDGKFIIHTNEIIGYADNGKYYYFGSYRIEYELGRTGVNYHGGTPRKGYWSEKDPHPHVDGRNGQPCLGNVGEAIAQLGSAHEYAALVTVAIEFLKAANTSDSAGRKVDRWDEYDIEKGEVKRKPSRDEDTSGTLVECYYTGNTYPISETTRVYLECDEDYNVDEERYVNNQDLEERFSWCDGADEWVHDDAEVFN